MRSKIQVCYELDKQMFIQMMMLHYKLHQKPFWIMFFGLFIFLVYINWPLSFSVYSLSLVLVPILMGYFALRMLSPILYGMRFKHLKLMHGKRQMTFSDENFTLTAKMIDVSLNYKAIEKIRRNDEFLLLYISSVSFHFIPITAFKSKKDLETLWDILQSKIEDAKTIN